MYQIANLQFEELIRNRNSIFVSLICKDSYWNLISDLFCRTRENSLNQKIIFLNNRSSHQRCSLQKVVLRNFTKFTVSTCVRVSFLIKLGFEKILLEYIIPGRLIGQNIRLFWSYYIRF